MKKVLWFSRHTMTDAQHKALVNTIGEFELTQIEGTAPNVHVSFKGSKDGKQLDSITPLKELVKEFDVVAAVLPINLQQQILPFMGNTPLISAESKRVENGKNEKGETKYEFQFVRWYQIHEVKIVTTDFTL